LEKLLQVASPVSPLKILFKNFYAR
jgi:hypothetical protein